MLRFPRRGCALLLLVLVGCGQPVREDRTVAWSPQGDTVTFQHGQEGVFVADKAGGGPQKIFQPGTDVLATSTPLWSPDGKRLIFTTARALDGGSSQPIPAEPDPAGNVHLQRPVIYTCWLRTEEKNGKAQEPVRMFEAACNHVGYVAANLAVRWHPDGNRILYVKEVENHCHGIFQYDLAAGQSRQVCPHTAEAMLFDWAPDNEHLVCVLAGAQGSVRDNGIWIGRPETQDWWHVPESGGLAEPELPSLLESLRATYPAFTADACHFAFVSSPGPAAEGQPKHHSLWLGTLPERTVGLLAEGAEPFRELHWTPDGKQLGVVRGREKPTLHLLLPGGKLSQPIDEHPVRSFAGWSAGGEHLAYVVPDRIPFTETETWAFLLEPDLLARDTVHVANGQGGGPGRVVFSGMRVTFPHWSPKEEKLSVWFTFSPTYRSVFSRFMSFWLASLPRLTLRRGDPAAVFDVKTGNIHWLAVNANEKAQVGHYYMLKRDYAEAWRWYEQAGPQPAPPRPPRPSGVLASGLTDYAQHLVVPDDWSFFQYYCLTKLGRHEEARTRLEQFRRTFVRPLPSDEEEPLLALVIEGRTMRQRLQEFLDPARLSGALMRDLYAAEVFLSLDAARDGEAFFRESLDNADSEPVRLSSALVLSQFLLLQKKHQEYADLASGTIAPLLAKLHHRTPVGFEEVFRVDALQEMTLLFAGGGALAPLLFPDFLAALPDDRVRALLPRWQALQAAARDDGGGQASDLLLHTAYQRLGMAEEERATADRFVKEHHGSADLLDPKKRGELLEQGRKAMRMP